MSVFVCRDRNLNSLRQFELGSLGSTIPTTCTNTHWGDDISYRLACTKPPHQRSNRVLTVPPPLLRYKHSPPIGLASAPQCLIKYRSIIGHFYKNQWSYVVVSPECFEARGVGCWCQRPLQERQGGGGRGGLSYSSVFKTGLEKKEEKRARHGLLISRPMKRSFSPASWGPTEQRTVFITRGPSPLRPERRCVCSGFSCRALEHSGAPGDLREEPQVGQLQAAQVGGPGLKDEMNQSILRNNLRSIKL